MKANDIIQQLALLLPKNSNKFTSNFSVTSLTRSGTTVTALTSAPHGLVIGQQVNIVGAKTPLTVASLTRSGAVGTLVTDNNHDLTQGIHLDIEVSGATEAEFNGTFTILTVPNRKTVTFTMADAGPTTATGSPLLINGASALQQYNGLYNVATVPTTTSFTYEITDNTLYSPAAGTIEARTNPRISGAVNGEILLQAYTQKPADDLWAFVVLADRFASKSRHIDSDAVDDLPKGVEYRQQMVFPFSVFVYFPTSDQIAALNSRDDCEDIFKYLCQSLCGSLINSNLSSGAQRPITAVGHSSFAYNSAFYVHQFDFQTVADLTFDDTIRYDLDVAFRDVDLSQTLNIGTAEDPLTQNINLDETPLP